MDDGFYYKGEYVNDKGKLIQGGTFTRQTIPWSKYGLYIANTIMLTKKQFYEVIKAHNLVTKYLNEYMIEFGNINQFYVRGTLQYFQVLELAEEKYNMRINMSVYTGNQ